MATKRSIITPKFEEDDNKAKSDFFNDFSDTQAHDRPEALIPKTAQDEKKSSTKAQRVKTGLTIFGSFMVIIFAGPFYCCLLVWIIELGLFREIINLKRNYTKEVLIKSSTYLVWYLYIIGSIFFFVWNFQDMLVNSSSPTIHFIARYRNLIFFAAYLSFFLLFVLSLRFGYIRYQVRLFVETHISLLIVASVGSIMLVIYDGIIWFLIPAVAVILNDCWAYVFGLTFGRTKLIDLSPKKTLEGFLGGLVGTMLSMRLVVFLASWWPFNFLYCPHYEISLVPFEFKTCELSAMYVRRDIYIPLVSHIFGRVHTSEFVIHVMVISLFASVIAPFAGFFASGLKRGLKIKAGL